MQPQPPVLAQSSRPRANDRTQHNCVGFSRWSGSRTKSWYDDADRVTTTGDYGSGDTAMGAGIATTNSELLAERIRALRDALDGWILELERDGGPDQDRLEARFRAARRRLESDGPGA